MNEELWSKVDDYFVRRLFSPEEGLSHVLRSNASAGLPLIDVSPAQGKLLYLLAKLTGARRVLEVGTLGGYSTLWLAKALPSEGKVVTLELEPLHAEVARRNFELNAVASMIEVIVGKALDSLELIQRRGGELFDLAFIDADKVNTMEYFQRAVTLCRPGALIIVDNVVRKGQVLESESIDPSVVGIRRFIEALSVMKSVEATAVQTVGAKGYDGFIVARVLGSEA